MKIKCCTLLCLLYFVSSARATPPSRLHGYVGGPYKVLIGELTGDQFPDVLLGYHQLGVVSVWQGDGRGGLIWTANNMFGDEDRALNPNDATWSVPHIHNLYLRHVDKDGLPDVVFSVGGNSRTKPGRVIVARNKGQGHFQNMAEFSTLGQAKGVALVDMDQDGILDLLYTTRGSGYEDALQVGRLSIRPGLGEWQYGPALISPAGRSAYYVETADLNNDGFLDVVIPNEHDSCATYFINPGKTLFRQKSLSPQVVRATRIPGKVSHAINDVRVADFNGDGNQDLVTANLGTSTISIFLGQGDGTFQQDTLFDAGKNGAFLAVGDFDRDRDIDFVITHWTEDFASVFLNDGSGTFAARTDYKTGLRNYGVATADLNQDGYLDIVTANYQERSMSVLIGIGNGQFAESVTTAVGLRHLDGKWHTY
ncbi:MAG: VCBS repeat-containing protein [Pirellulaceae bacterium]|nr:VCBS repeat-containing protein [Pirellulaceae bacterium]